MELSKQDQIKIEDIQLQIGSAINGIVETERRLNQVIVNNLAPVRFPKKLPVVKTKLKSIRLDLMETMRDFYEAVYGKKHPALKIEGLDLFNIDEKEK